MLLGVLLAVVLVAAVLAPRRGGVPQPAAGSGLTAGAPNGAVVVHLAGLHAAADAMGVGLVRIDRQGRIVSANEAAHRFLGWREGSLAGKSVMEGFVDHRVEELVRRARAAGPGLLELTSVGEPQQTLIVRARPIEREGGVWVTLEDVSELRRLQRIRTEFIDNLSHELRTPLTTVRLLTETLTLELERTSVPQRIRDSILQIDVETAHLVQMVNELLELAQIEQGEVPLQLAEVDLGAVIGSSLDRLRPYAERQGIELRTELPADPADRRLTADEQRVGQLLSNLVHNAIKFSPAGGEVVVRLRLAVDELTVEVEDSGAGIPADELERIFERFYKVDRARSREGGGTGLGLSIARHIAERHGGRIWAESEEGHGARFHVALPRRRQLETA